jgi:hypothetical protein
MFWVINILCRHVILSELKVNQINNKLQNLGRLCGAKGEQITTWMELVKFKILIRC